MTSVGGACVWAGATVVMVPTVGGVVVPWSPWWVFLSTPVLTVLTVLTCRSEHVLGVSYDRPNRTVLSCPTSRNSR